VARVLRAWQGVGVRAKDVAVVAPPAPVAVPPEGPHTLRERLLALLGLYSPPTRGFGMTS
jgi:hypothetical protein